jgi:2-oxoglutarate ferredoxin oxidoreductase subunit alpha
MKLNILFGGKAGQGANILTHILGESLIKHGYYVFYSRDYQSLIRGGHNFNVLTLSNKPTYSNERKIDVIIALNEDTVKIHKKNLTKNGMLIHGNHNNMFFAGRIFKILGLDFKILEQELKKLRCFSENVQQAKKGYEFEQANINLKKIKSVNKSFINGSQGISQGAIKSGLDVYIAYPMTPATTVLSELADSQIEKNYLVLQLENEVSVINAGIGSAITGAKSMVGTSGGGFDLMTEALSLTGVAGIPLVVYLSQRPGPGTGVATYTSQGDLNIARHSGHGEFPRVVLAPGDPNECEELTSQGFYFSQRFRIPVILLGDKHLGESFYTLTQKPVITSSKKSTFLSRYNSYEKDPKTGSATEDSEIVKINIEARLKKGDEIKKEAKKFKEYKIYGKKNSKNIVLSWGSTKGAILDVLNDLDIDCQFIQILYLEPFPQIKEKLQNKNLILIENNSTAQLGNLVTEKTGIFIEEKNKILKYDGRPFLSDELKEEIKKRLK